MGSEPAAHDGREGETPQGFGDGTDEAKASLFWIAKERPPESCRRRKLREGEESLD